ncbi:hypothetical protein BT93_H2877 [Corymbia citriodora subsp. variegata]|nr:hypothetical protein BT93_H2877 [Corymbia citriodora subsp. variegata]KAF8017810.1 hypothetical protein BT93_H2877 [Corymbia citriodora subsp. variegata]
MNFFHKSVDEHCHSLSKSPQQIPPCLSPSKKHCHSTSVLPELEETRFASRARVWLFALKSQCISGLPDQPQNIGEDNLLPLRNA